MHGRCASWVLLCFLGAAAAGDARQNGYGLTVVWDHSKLAARQHTLSGAGCMTLLEDIGVVVLRCKDTGELVGVDVEDGAVRRLAEAFPTIPQWGPGARKEVLYSVVAMPCGGDDDDSTPLCNLTATAFNVVTETLLWGSSVVLPMLGCSSSAVTLVDGDYFIAEVSEMQIPSQFEVIISVAFDTAGGDVLWMRRGGSYSWLAPPVIFANGAMWQGGRKDDILDTSKLAAVVNVSRRGVDVVDVVPPHAGPFVKQAGSMLIRLGPYGYSGYSLRNVPPRHGRYEWRWSIPDRGFLAAYSDGARVAVSDDGAHVCCIRFAASMLSFELVCADALSGRVLWASLLPDIRPNALEILPGAVAAVVDDLRIFNLSTGLRIAGMAIPSPDLGMFRLARLKDELYSLSWGAQWLAFKAGPGGADERLPAPQPPSTASWGTPLLLVAPYLPPGLAVPNISCEFLAGGRHGATFRTTAEWVNMSTCWCALPAAAPPPLTGPVTVFVRVAVPTAGHGRLLSNYSAAAVTISPPAEDTVAGWLYLLFVGTGVIGVATVGSLVRLALRRRSPYCRVGSADGRASSPALEYGTS
eukprot:TRINITY_DN5337_c0_g3_i1.p1 TRINITY_DN5337_c0_g3~~TRINITY_DN5337_c0_g3_i1.p1  ORF type:complete len:582 (+),score=94.60 TRINITY_DN5337_c0_g3_i1:117-1862(+)